MVPASHTTLAALAIALACHTPPAATACDRCVPHPASHDTSWVDTATLLRDLDQRAAAAASARPGFSFPARIGIARIENGVVTPIPGDEWTAWRNLRDQMPPTFGELSPVSAIVAQSLTASPVSATPHDAITNLRLAAAREHLDAILLYCVSTTHSLEQTELTLLDATIVGAWWFPTHKSHTTAHASATLIDVRSGLAYGSAIGNATDVTSATLLGSEEKIHRQRAATTRKSVAALSPEISNLLVRLAQSPSANHPRDERPTPTTPPHAATTDRTIPPPVEGGDSFWARR